MQYLDADYDAIRKPRHNIFIETNKFRYELEFLIENHPFEASFITKYKNDILVWWNLFDVAIDNMRKEKHAHADEWAKAFDALQYEVSQHKVQQLSEKLDSYWISILASDDILMRTTMGSFFVYLHDVHYENIDHDAWRQYIKAPANSHTLLAIDSLPPCGHLNGRTDVWPSDAIQDPVFAFYALCWHKYHGLEVINEEGVLKNVPESVCVLYHMGAYTQAWSSWFDTEISHNSIQEASLML